MAAIRVKRGTQAQLDAAAAASGLAEGEPYLITDGGGGFAVGLSASTYRKLESALTAASQAEMETGTESAIRSMSPLRVAQAIAALAAGGSASASPLDATAFGAL